MRLTRRVGAALVGGTLIAACQQQAEQPRQEAAQEDVAAKDRVVRLYIQDELVPYLDSLAKQVCQLRDPTEAIWLCPGPERDGYRKPPKDGTP
jgi:hypothetical protein